jgi:hypothetical protein
MDVDRIADAAEADMLDRHLSHVLRHHHLLPEPDEQGRALRCTCGWWDPGASWASHLRTVLAGQGLTLRGPHTASGGDA